MRHELPSLEYLKQRIDYDPLTSVAVWKPLDELHCDSKRWNGRYAGNRIDNKRVIHIDKQTYKTGQIIWLMHTGKAAPDEIDHINCNDRDNHIGNLRPATSSQNKANKGIPSNNTIGVKGLARSGIGYQAKIKFNGKTINLGTYRTIEEAAAVRKREFEKLFGEFARHE